MATVAEKDVMESRGKPASLFLRMKCRKFGEEE